jgi:hypothetical protein
MGDEHWPAYEAAIVTIDGIGVLRPSARTTRPDAFPFDAAVVHIITPCNPGGPEIAPAANAERVERLRSHLTTIGVTTVPTVGSDVGGGHAEPGFLVSGLSRTEAMDIGAAFDQDAVYEWTRDALRIVACAGDRVVESGWSLEAGAVG